MKRRRIPMLFRLSAALLLTALIVGQWWQRQPAGSIAGWMPAMAEVYCPAAAIHRAGTIADSARTLDSWGYAVIGNAIFRDGRDRCRVRNPALTGITMFLPRDGRCHIQSGCRLWVSKSGNRGLILPQNHVRGHFRLAPREIVHIDGKPAADLSEGIERASRWLTRQVMRPGVQYDDAQCTLWAKAA